MSATVTNPPSVASSPGLERVKSNTKRANVAFASEQSSKDSPSSPSLRALSPPPQRYLRRSSVTNLSSGLSSQKDGREDELDDSDPWARPLVLSLDGGGIRGYASLLVLDALMKEIIKAERLLDKHIKSSAEPAVSSKHRRVANTEKQDANNEPDAESDDDFLPCHYFDFIAGTSTGGLIAILIGRLRLSVPQCKKEIDALFESVRFPRILPRSRSWPTEKLEKDLRKTIDTLNMPSGDLHTPLSDANFRSSPEQCKTIVIGFLITGGIGSPYLWRSYDINTQSINHWERNAQTKEAFSVWQVARATSASSTFFKPLKVKTNTKTEEFSDVGILNPSLEVFTEVQSLKGRKKPLELILSIGVKVRRSDKTGISCMGVVRRLNKIISDADWAVDVDKLMGREEAYHRLAPEVPGSIFDSAIFHRKETTERLEKLANAYFEDEAVKAELRQCARLLVEYRRKRTRTGRWEFFATGTMYRCPFDVCESTDRRYTDRSELLDHVMRHHGVLPPDPTRKHEVEDILQQGIVQPPSAPEVNG